MMTLSKSHKFELFQYDNQNKAHETINQMADELDVTRQYIYKIIKDFSNETEN